MGLNWMEGGCDGGEAVELALQEAVREHDKEAVTQIIFIGDECPHLEGKGNDIRDGVTLSTDYREQTRNLSQRDVPIHSFYIPDTWNDLDNLQRTFKEMSEGTGGITDAMENADQLVDIVCEKVLQDVGGDDLVAEYRSRYG